MSVTSSAPWPPSNIPIPDPSVITEREITKAKTELRAEIIAAVTSLRELMTLRCDTIENASAQRAATAGLLRDQQMTNIHQIIHEDKVTAAAAVQAALTAQKEAIAAQNTANTAAISKSEAAVAKELDALDDKITLLKESVARDIANLTSRLDRGEGGFLSVRREESDRRAGITVVVAVVSGVVGVIVLLVTIVGLWLSVHSSSSIATTPSAIAVTPLTPSAVAPAGK